VDLHPKTPEGVDALTYHLKRLRRFLVEVCPGMDWAEVGFMDSPPVGVAPTRSMTTTLEDYRPRFEQLMDAGHGWINMSAVGVDDEMLLVTLEWPGYTNTIPRAYVSVNLSGPMGPWGRPYLGFRNERLAPEKTPERMERAFKCLDGLSVGDAFGERFFGPEAEVKERIRRRERPPEPWAWTDDTAMARCVCWCLDIEHRIQQDTLARLFSEEYARDPARGYGSMLHSLLPAFRRGMPWKHASRRAFGGAGSYGNGGSMRVGPVGAYFADEIGKAIEQARLSAEVTHAHPEGQAGAQAVAAAAAWAAIQGTGGRELLEFARTHTPQGQTRAGLDRALELDFTAAPEQAAAALGSGQQVASWDTVPFSLWCAARHPDSFPDAMWATVAGLGDRDTTCAIVGGIVALSAPGGVPEDWLASREPL
jgi:ADP-ribosylglycohydrolase